MGLASNLTPIIIIKLLTKDILYFPATTVQNIVVFFYELTLINKRELIIIKDKSVKTSC